ncbi:MAG: 16S rRNA (guanine(527)-N(7))-methyltransferase RsmG [Firmicutes bacterium]|nr:16S rRNA (guanine(527)-N(7))-methyltransferase RsmG [Bacillota bacterium]
MNEFMLIIKEGASALGIEISEQQLEKLWQHWCAVKEAPFNLTAIKDDREAAEKHYLDSIAALPQIPAGELWCDIGTGAGFPGLVLAVMRPEQRILLLESNGKKCGFLTDMAAKLGLSKVEVLNSRAETAAKTRRDSIDVVMARAVSHVSVLAEYAAPLLRLQGTLVCYKGPGYAQELSESKAALMKLGMKAGAQAELLLPNGEQRIIGKLVKHAPTPKAYPRREGMAENKPLVPRETRA